MMIAMKRTVVIFLTFNDEQNEKKEKKNVFCSSVLNHFVSDKFCCEIYILEEIDKNFSKVIIYQISC